MGNLTDIRTGTVVKVNNQPYLVVWNEFNRKQQRKPVMRTKLKNLIDGSALDKTFLAGESFEFAEIERQRCQYLYKDATEAHFMNNETFEQFTLPVEDIEESLVYLKDDTEVYVTFYEGQPIGVQPPVKVTLEVVKTVPGVKGDTAQGGTKPATVETGAVVSVPLFVKEGDKIVINTETGEYVSRAAGFSLPAVILTAALVMFLVLPPVLAQEYASYCGDGTLNPEVEQCDDGNFLDRDGCSSYCLIEDLEPPQILGTSIGYEAQGVSTLTNEIRVTFSEPIDASSLNFNTVKLRQYSYYPPIEIELLPNQTEMVIHVLEELEGNKEYAIVIRDIKDVPGNTNYDIFISPFTTGNYIDVTPPTVVVRSPGGLYHVGQAVTLTPYIGSYTKSDEFIDQGATVYYTLDGTTPTEYGLSYESPLSIRDDATLKVFGIDAAGNRTEIQTHEYSFSCPEFSNAKEVTPYPDCVVLECNYGFILRGNVCVIQLGDSIINDYKINAATAPLFGSDTPVTISTKPALYITPEHNGIVPRPIHFIDLSGGTIIDLERDTLMTHPDGTPFTGYLIPPSNLYSKSFPINFGYSFKSIFHMEPAEAGELFFDPMYKITVPFTDRYDEGAPITVFTFDPIVEEYFVHDPSLVTVNAEEGTVSIMADRTGTFFVAQPGLSFNAIVFQDTVNHWAKNYIEMLYRLGYVKGRDKGIFAPDDPITRAEFTKIALNAIGEEVDPLEEIEEAPFRDVPIYAWYAPYIKRAKDRGLISGYPSGLFKPDEPINRVEAVKILMAGFQFDLESVGQRTDNFQDILTWEWYFPSINFAVQHGLIDGLRLANGIIQYDIFGPGNNMTRAEMAKLAVKSIELKDGKIL